METRSRRRDRTLGAGKHRLVIGAVARITAGRTFDIGRQRHRAVAGERLAECLSFELEVQGCVTLRMLLGDIGGEILREDDPVTDPQPARAFGKGTPHAICEIAMQGQFNRPGAAAAREPCRDHLGVVEDEKITGPQ